MPSFLLPPGTPVCCEQKVDLFFSPGASPTLAAAYPATPFPQFYVDASDQALHEWGLSDEAHALCRHGRKWPVEWSSEGLRLDPQWAIFQSFRNPQELHDFNRLARVRSGEYDWRLRCASLQGPETLIGQLAMQYGVLSSAIPENHRYTPTPAMQRFSLDWMIRDATADELVAFRDRTDTLLDLGLRYQQWEFADYLWCQGVRPSPETVQSGRYLEALIIGTFNLGESNVYGFAEPHQRLPWLTRWLDRFAELGGRVPTTPTLDWRTREWTAHGKPHLPVLDTAPALWIAHFVNPYNKMIFPAVQQVPHQARMVQAWAAFWADHGIDVETVQVARCCDPKFTHEVVYDTGIKEAYAQCEGIDPWVELVRHHQQARLLDRRTLSSAVSRATPRL